MTAGLSILIPIFNWDVNELVEVLLAQRADWPGLVEIILFDDASREEFRALNRPLLCHPGVQYHELAQNMGRAAIRNQLATAAQQEWLLLLDNDSLLPDTHFLARYAAMRSQAAVLIGGTCYSSLPPANTDLRLHWLYGQAREARMAAQRQLAPYAQLTINNALLRTDVLTRYPLDERLSGYGHEDTQFGRTLATGGVPILHLDNPVLHAGLEPAAIFLTKSEEAVRNLAQAFRTDGLSADSRLLQMARRLRKWGISALAQTALHTAEPRLRRNLLSANPSLRAFDLLKLSWLLKRL